MLLEQVSKIHQKKRLHGKILCGCRAKIREQNEEEEEEEEYLLARAVITLLPLYAPTIRRNERFLNARGVLE